MSDYTIDDLGLLHFDGYETWWEPATPAEVVSVLLPDVDWEALREEAEAYHLYGDTEWLGGEAAFGLVRRLLAVYDGKDGA